MLLEVKSCTLVRGNAALFPDAPTKRGTKHLRSLVDGLGQGCEAAVAFVVQRPDADRFSPNDETDPDFGAALREASSRGVNVYAYICRVSLREIALWKRIRVLL